MQLSSEDGHILSQERAATASSPSTSDVVPTKTPDWEDQNVFQRNRLPPRSYYIPDTSLCLNGTWSFNYAPTPYHAPDGTRASEVKPSASAEAQGTSREFDPHICEQSAYSWSPITVPGHWQLQGHGRPQYTNVVYPFPACPPYAPTENPTGTYRRTFEVPPHWHSTSQIRLRFDGVDSAFYLFVNGVKVGYSQGSRNPAEFDVTSHVRRDGPNILVVQNLQWCSASYIEDQDQWWLSGR